MYPAELGDLAAEKSHLEGKGSTCQPGAVRAVIAVMPVALLKCPPSKEDKVPGQQMSSEDFLNVTDSITKKKKKIYSHPKKKKSPILASVQDEPMNPLCRVLNQVYSLRP